MEYYDPVSLTRNLTVYPKGILEFLKVHRKARVLISLALVVTSATSQQICVGLKKVPQQGEKRQSASRFAEPPPVDFSMRGKGYKINTRNSQLELLSTEGQVLQRVDVRQSIGGGISEMVMQSNGWLWVNGSDTDYFIYVNMDEVHPKLTKLINISMQRDEECLSKGADAELSCIPADSFYSKALGRILVVTYPKKGGGSLYEVEQGRFKRLFNDFKGWRENRVEDLPSIKRVFIFGATDGYLYDGKIITPLHLNHFRDQNGRARWWLPYSAGERVFLTDDQYKEKGNLYEILPSGALSDIPFNDSVSLGQGFYEVGGKVLVFGDRGIYLLTDKVFKKIVSVAGRNRISYVRLDSHFPKVVKFRLYEDDSMQKVRAQYALSPSILCKKLKAGAPFFLEDFN